MAPHLKQIEVIAFLQAKWSALGDEEKLSYEMQRDELDDDLRKSQLGKRLGRPESEEEHRRSSSRDSVPTRKRDEKAAQKHSNPRKRESSSSKQTPRTPKDEGNSEISQDQVQLSVNRTVVKDNDQPKKLIVKKSPI